MYTSSFILNQLYTECINSIHMEHHQLSNFNTLNWEEPLRLILICYDSDVTILCVNILLLTYMCISLLLKLQGKIQQSYRAKIYKNELKIRVISDDSIVNLDLYEKRMLSQCYHALVMWGKPLLLACIKNIKKIFSIPIVLDFGLFTILLIIML